MRDASKAVSRVFSINYSLKEQLKQCLDARMKMFIDITIKSTQLPIPIYSCTRRRDGTRHVTRRFNLNIRYKN